MSDIERRNILHFCIVGEQSSHVHLCTAIADCVPGGGPTGVEFAAELHDLLNTDIKKHFPTLFSLARISLFDVAPRILGGFDVGLQEYVRTVIDSSLLEPAI